MGSHLANLEMGVIVDKIERGWLKGFTVEEISRHSGHSADIVRDVLMNGDIDRENWFHGKGTWVTFSLEEDAWRAQAPFHTRIAMSPTLARRLKPLTRVQTAPELDNPADPMPRYGLRPDAQAWLARRPGAAGYVKWVDPELSKGGTLYYVKYDGAPNEVGGLYLREELTVMESTSQG